ncbi:MAG: ABC transporter ATP-binding protein/permease [Candidatus Dormibacteraeota bacterium]|nr:ABC transporter ATP-binding protein/permease [Candidatus Dormibacteraeota bacterium]
MTEVRTARIEPDPDGWRGVASDEVDDLDTSRSRELGLRSRALVRELLAPYRARLALSMLLIGARTAGMLSIPWLVGQAIDHAVTAGSSGATRALLERYVVMLIGAVMVVAGSGYGFLRLSGSIGQAILFDLRLRLFTHVQDLSLSFYERYTSGRIIARLTSDIDALQELLSTGLASVLTSAISIVVTAVILVRMDGRLGSAILLSFPLVLLLSLWFRSNSARSYRAVRHAIALLIVHYVESLNGIRAVQAFRREGRNQAIFEDVNARYRDANTWSNRLASTFGPAISLLGRLTTVGVLAYGGWLVVQGSLTLGILTAFILYVRQFFDPMQELSQFYNLIQAAAAALEKISTVLDEQPTVAEPVDRDQPPAIDGRVTFEHVTFGYGSEPVLHDIHLEFPAGQVVAIVGATGAGKTTIARLVGRFYDPATGAVRLDGIDLRQLTHASLRGAVVTVTQESFMFTGSIATNIGFGRPEATRAEVEAAARAVGLHTFIEVLPDGYDTDVRRRGVRLSAGQRQLVAFARAFLADPRVLILDEATSSLDVPSEVVVQRALKTLLAGRTAFIIAHRLSTVAIADRVIVLDNGRVVEDGTPDALMEDRSGRYGALHSEWLHSLELSPR